MRWLIVGALPPLRDVADDEPAHGRRPSHRARGRARRVAEHQVVPRVGARASIQSLAVTHARRVAHLLERDDAHVTRDAGALGEGCGCRGEGDDAGTARAAALATFTVESDPDAARAPPSVVGTAYGVVVVVGNEAPSIADHAANTAIGTMAASTKRVARCGDRATAISSQPRAHPQ